MCVCVRACVCVCVCMCCVHVQRARLPWAASRKGTPSAHTPTYLYPSLSHPLPWTGADGCQLYLLNWTEVKGHRYSFSQVLPCINYCRDQVVDVYMCTVGVPSVSLIKCCLLWGCWSRVCTQSCTQVHVHMYMYMFLCKWYFGQVCYVTCPCAHVPYYMDVHCGTCICMCVTWSCSIMWTYWCKCPNLSCTLAIKFYMCLSLLFYTCTCMH